MPSSSDNIDRKEKRSHQAERASIANPLISHPQRLATILVILAAFIASIPAFSSYIPHGHDIQFNLFRIDGIASALSDGQFPVRMQYSQLGGYGYPVSICYGDLFLYFPALLNLLGLDIEYSYLLFIMAVNALSSFIAYKCFKSMFSSPYYGALGCILWILCPYRLTDIWLRAAVGESLALIFYPLIALGIYQIFSKHGADTNRRSLGFVWLAIGASGVIYSHVISILLCLIIGIPAIIIGLIHNHSKEALIQLGLSIVLALCLSAAFIVPFCDYYLGGNLAVSDRTLEYKRNIAARNSLQPGQLFMIFSDFAGWNKSLHKGVAEEMPLSLGSVGLLVLLLWISLEALLGTKAASATPTRLFIVSGRILIAASLILMFMTTCLFPWKLDMGTAVNALIGLLATIQFPWRLLGPIGICLTLAGLLACIIIRPLSQKASRTIMTALAICALLEGAFCVSSFYGSSQPVEEYETVKQNGHGIGAGEYLPSGTTKKAVLDSLTENIRLSDGALVTHFEKTGTNLTLHASSRGNAAQAILPLLYYPNYALTQETQPPESCTLDIQDGTGFMILNIPPHYSGDIMIKYEVPWQWTASLILSYATAAGICLIIIRQFFRIRHAGF